MPAKKPKSARELAARALCRFNKLPEDTQFEGRPMWESYLPEVDMILEAIGWREPGEDPPPLRVIATPRKREGGVLSAFADFRKRKR